MQHGFVLDAQRRLLKPCRPARARLRLVQRKAAVLRREPFTIIFGEARPDATVALRRVKIDPGRRTTRITMVNDASGALIWAAEVLHRGKAVQEALVQEALVQRRTARRCRRQRSARYRAPRFQNRRRALGWLPPSLERRLHNILTWVERLRRLCPSGAISSEAVRCDCDTELLHNPDISGLEYQQGTLAGTEIREYLLLKWGSRCACCHQNAPRWEVEHSVPRSHGGSHRASNLARACKPCNEAKGERERTAEEFGHPEVQAQAKAPLQEAAAVNSMRRALHQRLLRFGLPVESGSGGLPTFNRTQRHLPKAHWLDAACVGTSTPLRLRWHEVLPHVITAHGWQRRQLCLVDRYGFRRTTAKEQSRVFGFGFKMGDLVRAQAPTREGVPVSS